MTYTHSTHLIDFGVGYGFELAVVCGNYCRRLRTYVSGRVQLAPWTKIPNWRKGIQLTPCVEPLIEKEPEGICDFMADRHT